MNRISLRVALLALSAAIGLSVDAAAQGLTLTPAVVQLEGRTGQGITQTLRIVNRTNTELAFTLEAQDVVVREGRRAFVRAGDLTGSIAATAVFMPAQVTVPAGASQTVDVTMTVPESPASRAVVVLFRGTTPVPSGETRVLASLGTLFTFTLSGQLSIASEAPILEPQTAAGNATFEQWLVNDGSEPVVISGVAVVLDARGSMIAKAAFNPRRALPGERLAMKTDLSQEVGPGEYRVLLTFAYAGRTLTSAAAMRVE